MYNIKLSFTDVDRVLTTAEVTAIENILKYEYATELSIDQSLITFTITYTLSSTVGLSVCLLVPGGSRAADPPVTWERQGDKA